MSYSNGTAYYTKSMNGVITYDDGQGTVIENGMVTTALVETNDINCLFTLSAPAIVTDTIGSSTNLTLSSSASAFINLPATILLFCEYLAHNCEGGMFGVF